MAIATVKQGIAQVKRHIEKGAKTLSIAVIDYPNDQYLVLVAFLYDDQGHGGMMINTFGKDFGKVLDFVVANCGNPIEGPEVAVDMAKQALKH